MTELTPLEKLEKYQEDVCKDLKINEMTLSDKSFDIPQKKHYWAARFILESQKLNKLEREKKSLEKKLLNAQQDISPVKLSATSFKHVIANTDAMQSLTETIEDQKLLVEYLGKVEKIFSFITNDVKNIIEIKQMELL